jgi:hypothetical protein
MTDDLDREVLDLLDVVIAGAPACNWPECRAPATWRIFDVVNCQYALTCDACREQLARNASVSESVSEWVNNQKRAHPDERLPHADALERTMAKRDRLKGEQR